MRTVTARLRGPGAGRLLWAGLAAVHAAPWLGATVSLAEDASLSALGGWAGLSLTVLFFALKTLDVAWLRLGSRRRTALAVVLASALVHHDAVSPGLDEAGTAAVLVTATALEAARAIPLLRASLAAAPSLPLPQWRPCLVHAVALRPLDPIAVRRASRAPPFAA